MRNTTRLVTEADVHELGRQWGLDVGAHEAADLAEQINDRLGSLDSVYEIPIRTDTTDVGNRSWTEGSDEYNAIRVDCQVPPATDHTALLEGVEIGLKDLISVAGVPMQCGSGVMEGYVPSADATVTDRLRRAGGTITAKTTLDEFAGGGRGRTFRGLVCNPRDEDRIAGGSSGGSGAAVAAGLVDVALGTDTGGSTRKPAAFCGLVGLKPTYGLVSLTGVIENTYTLDHVGPIARTVKDVAVVLEAIAGRDETDPASMAAAGDSEYAVGGYIEAVESPPPIDELRIGVGTQGVTDEIDPTVATRHDAAITALEEAGVSLTEIEIPYLDHTKALKNAISYTELAAYWRDRGMPVRRGGVADPFDQVGFARRASAANRELNDFYRSRLLTGAQLATVHDGRHYTRARAAQAVVRDAVEDELAAVDALVTPTVPELAPKIDDVLDPAFDYDGLDSTYGYGRYTKIANVTGLPAITIPNEVDSGPAVGIQLIGSRFDERTLLGTAQRIFELLGDGDGA